MSNLLSFLLSSLLLYKYWVLLAVFFFSGLILPLPTSTVLLATGAFASQGYFNFFISLAVIVGANMLGDCLGYFFAKKYGKKTFHILHIRTPTWVERIDGFLRTYPGSTIFVTRFSGTTDVLINLLCGFSGISLTVFLIYDFLGNLVSNGVLLYTGYFLGIHWQDFTGLFNIFDYIIISIAMIVALLIVMWRNKRRKHIA